MNNYMSIIRNIVIFKCEKQHCQQSINISFEKDSSPTQSLVMTEGKRSVPRTILNTYHQTYSIQNSAGVSWLCFLSLFSLHVQCFRAFYLRVSLLSVFVCGGYRDFPYAQNNLNKLFSHLKCGCYCLRGKREDGGEMTDVFTQQCAPMILIKIFDI